MIDHQKHELLTYSQSASITRLHYDQDQDFWQNNIWSSSLIFFFCANQWEKGAEMNILGMG
jgi:hypothetical protein